MWVKWTPTTTVNMRLDNCGAPASVGTKVRIYAGPSSSVTMAKLYPLTTGADSGDIPYNDCEGNIQTLKAQANQTYYIAVVRSKYMQTSDPGGTLYVEQSSVKPVVTFKSPPTQFGATAKVQFSSPDAVGFTCKLDGNATSCPRSGDDGTFQQGFSDHKTHTLSVVARNEFLTYGNTYIWSFNADGLAPDTVIDSPAPTTLGAYAVQFHASEAGATFKCQLVWETQPVPCTSPWTIQQTTYVGGHTVRVIASDKWGNADKTPADQKIYVTAPQTPVTPQTPVAPAQQQPIAQQPPVVQQPAGRPAAARRADAPAVHRPVRHEGPRRQADEARHARPGRRRHPPRLRRHPRAARRAPRADPPGPHDRRRRLRRRGPQAEGQGPQGRQGEAGDERALA